MLDMIDVEDSDAATEPWLDPVLCLVVVLKPACVQVVVQGKDSVFTKGEVVTHVVRMTSYIGRGAVTIAGIYVSTEANDVIGRQFA